MLKGSDLKGPFAVIPTFSRNIAFGLLRATPGNHQEIESKLKDILSHIFSDTQIVMAPKVFPACHFILGINAVRDRDGNTIAVSIVTPCNKGHFSINGDYPAKRPYQLKKIIAEHMSQHGYPHNLLWK